VGEWIPEPLPERTEWVSGRPGATTVDPADRVTLDESINMAFLVVLESMTAERVAFILHDVFRYLPLLLRRSGRDRRPYAGGMSPAGLLGPPSHPRVAGARGPDSPAGRHRQGLQGGMGAKDIDALIGLLDPEVTAIADGGGLAPAHLRPVQGGEQVVRAYVDIAHVAPNLTILESDDPGKYGQRPARPGRPARRHHPYSRSTLQAPGSSTSGQYATPRNSVLGRRVDARLDTIGLLRAAATRFCSR
jgi:RNA polymerase sigma-70 factor (ECF subfamily)